MPSSNKPEALKAAVIARSLAGDSKTQIARDLQINRNTVARIVREAQLGNIASADAKLKRVHITPERVISELGRLAFVDPRRFFNDDGTAKRIGELDDDTAAALAGIEVYEEFAGRGEDRELIGHTKKFKIADKGVNLERLGRHFGLFRDNSAFNVAIQVNGDLPRPSRGITKSPTPLEEATQLQPGPAEEPQVVINLPRPQRNPRPTQTNDAAGMPTD